MPGYAKALLRNPLVIAVIGIYSSHNHILVVQSNLGVTTFSPEARPPIRECVPRLRRV